jgi:NADH-quinone oxidoreductase subunit M
MFLLVGVLYDRLHSRDIAAYGGVAKMMPKFTFFVILFAMANAGLPGTSGFVGEFLVILGTFQVSGWLAAAAATTLILGAAYTLWMIKRVMFGSVVKDSVASLVDLSRREMIFMSILAAFTLIVGLWPAPLLDAMRVTLENLRAHVAVSKL